MDTNEANDANKASSSNSTNSHGAILTSSKDDGVQLMSTTRLTSFRVPRDLTLGGNIKTDKTKKSYTPNLNVQRRKKGEAEALVNKTDKDKVCRNKVVKEKTKKSNNLIQSIGVFSEGLSESSKKRYRGIFSRDSSSDRSETELIEKPKLNAIPTINKEEEDEKLRLLLRDDFIDDIKEDSLENAPIALPLKIPKNIYSNNYTKLFTKTEPKIEVDIKPTILENGEVKISPINDLLKHKKEEYISPILDTLENKSNPNYIFMEFPMLPHLSVDDSSSNIQRKQATGISNNENSRNKSNDCALDHMKEGFIGRIQILRSGKARLVLEGHEFIVKEGACTSFRQDLMAIQINEEEKSGDFINLGPVGQTLIVCSDLDL